MSAATAAGSSLALVAVLVVGGSGAAASVGGADTGSTAALLAPGTRADLADGGDGRVRVSGAAGTALLALIDGRVRAAAPETITLSGVGADAGATVTYSGVGAPAAAAVHRGEVVARLATAGSAVVRLEVDGAPVDLAGLLGGATTAPGGAPGLTRPVSGAAISQRFGCTGFAAEPADAACPGGHFHSGIDLAAPQGAAVRAAHAGSIHLVRSPGGYGLHIVLTGGEGLSTLYGHLSGATVADGDSVVAGELIGAVGSTGNSTGPHLHFEVRHAGTPTDPLLELTLP